MMYCFRRRVIKGFSEKINFCRKKSTNGKNQKLIVRTGYQMIERHIILLLIGRAFGQIRSNFDIFCNNLNKSLFLFIDWFLIISMHFSVSFPLKWRYFHVFRDHLSSFGAKHSVKTGHPFSVFQ